MQRFEDPTRTIRVAVHEVFAVRLPGNPTTGYTWQASVNPRYLELVEQRFEPRSEGVGAGGHEVCHFRALGLGKTEISLKYRRPWDGEARETRRFEVVIK